MNFSKLSAIGVLSLFAAGNARQLKAKAAKPGECTPKSIAGVWTHMSQGLSFEDKTQGGGLRSWIVTCPELPYFNGPQCTDPNNCKAANADKVWGDGSCQIADANLHTDECGWLGVLEPSMMYVDEDTGKCAFEIVELKPKGHGTSLGQCDFSIFFKAIQDHEDMWWLWLATDGDDAKAGKWLNLGNPRHTTRNPK